MPRKVKLRTFDGLLIAYISESVDPQDPPNKCQLSILNRILNFSISSTKLFVVFSFKSEKGVEDPQPLWSN